MTGAAKKLRPAIRTLEDIKDRCTVDHDTGCWLWRGGMSRSKRRANLQPMCRAWLPGTEGERRAPQVAPARAAWLLAGLKLWPGHVVWRNVCFDSRCVSPEHGRAGTRRQMGEVLTKSGVLQNNPRRAAVNAVNRAASVLPVEVVRAAEQMYADGALRKDVVAALGIHCSTASKIRTGRHPHCARRERVLRGAWVFSVGVST